jgi:protein-S-isoprenylcysteine O-methyltransferase Ste14
MAHGEGGARQGAQDAGEDAAARVVELRARRTLMADEPDRMMSWVAGLIVITVLGQVCGLIVQMPVLFALAGMGASPRVIQIVGWLITAAAFVAAILSWRAMQKASRDEELRNR